MDKTFLVAVGKVVKAHGVRGALKLVAYGETLGEMKAGERLISCEGEAEQFLTIKDLSAKTVASRVGALITMIAWFEEIVSREQAEALTGNDLFVHRDRLPQLPADEYYHFQLIGLSVLTKEGKPLGTLRSVLETGGNDVYVVVNEGKELLIPAIEDVVSEVDLLNGKLIVDLPEGLQ
jgi:16S rRNA processing protein RimM